MIEMTKVIMHGCNGKMGQVITGLIAQDEDVKIVAGIDTYDEKKNDYPVYKTGTLHHRFIRRPAGESY